MDNDNSTVLVFKNALLDLLETVPLQDITVSKLSTKANKGRSTFYVYYDDVFSLYSEMIEENIAPLDQFIKRINNREDQMNSENNYGGVFDVICKNKRFYYVLFKSNEPYFLYSLRRVISNSMRDGDSEIPFPNFCYSVFADRFVAILKSLVLQAGDFPGPWLVRVTDIWLHNCGDKSRLGTNSLTKMFNDAVAGTEKYEQHLRNYLYDDGSLTGKFKAGLLKMIKNRPYYEISVVEIVNETGSSRTSFYKSYQSLEGLYNEICADVMKVLLEMFQDHTGTYYELICKISSLILNNRKVIVPLLSYANSRPFNDMFIDFLIRVQIRYFGLPHKGILHENLARSFLDIYDIFSHDVILDNGNFETVIYGRCQAVSETFDFCNNLNETLEFY